MKDVSRRELLQTSLGLAATAGLAAGCTTTPKAAPNSASGKATANDKIVLGFIGVAGRGSDLMSWFSAYDDVEIGAVCDVYAPHRENALALSGGTAKVYRDFRELLDQPNIDAVVIATPPHWHALMTVLACEAGKDVYCEKPMCLTPVEGRAMVKAARANHRITQVGTQIHASENYRRVVETVRSGVLGPISAVRTQLALNEAPGGIGHPPDTVPPSNLDWDLWLGPRPMMPFNPAKFEKGQFRYWSELSGNWLHEMGPHIVDLPYWALDLGAPKAVSAVGGKFVTNDISTIPDTLEVLFEFDDCIMTWSNMCANSQWPTLSSSGPGYSHLRIAFHGTNGTLTSNYSEHQVFPEGESLSERAQQTDSIPASPGHGREFLDAVKSRRLCSCDVAYHYKVHLALNLGDLAYRLGRKIHWDTEKEEVSDDREANQLLQPDYRHPWRLPV
jgi:predicted dehydrogenase